LGHEDVPGETTRSSILRIDAPEGTLSLEMMPIRPGVGRAFIKNSPRGLKLNSASSRQLNDSLLRTGPARILLADNKKKVVQNALSVHGWSARRAVVPIVDHKCAVCTTYDLPLDEGLRDDSGAIPQLTDTNHMIGVGINLGPRTAWGFYTDDGETARIVSEGSRKQGMMVASSEEDLVLAADCLIRFLAASRKKWAVFSNNMGRFIREYDPMVMWRMILEDPKGHNHSVRQLSRDNRKGIIRLYSEYYDEGMFAASLRLRRMSSDPNYSQFVTDGGFVIVRKEGEIGLIYDIYVTPSRQGEGIGGELMRCAMSSLAGRTTSVYLHTSYPRAKALYEKFGFKAVYSQLAVRLDEMALEPPST